MEIFPAIDLIDGACVRLKQGAFDAVTVYEADPLLQARRFEAEGARWLHVVDLDGAKNGEARQTPLLSRLAKETKLKVQAGGGVRSEADVEALLQAGAVRVVIGSLAAKEPEKVGAWLARFGRERIVLALDVRASGADEPEILTRGWQDRSGIGLWDFLERFQDKGLQTILCTDVARDGMLTGPNAGLYRDIAARFPSLQVLASGGVGNLDDLRSLAALKLAGVVTGKALYEKRFTLAEALAAGGSYAG